MTLGALLGHSTVNAEVNSAVLATILATGGGSLHTAKREGAWYWEQCSLCFAPRCSQVPFFLGEVTENAYARKAWETELGLRDEYLRWCSETEFRVNDYRKEWLARISRACQELRV